MTHFEVDHVLDSIVVLVDTREQDTPALRRRLRGIPYRHRRQKLDFGDYSCEITLPGGEVVSLKDKLAIERKMNLDELCMCFIGGRARFEREFKRAQDAGAKVYLLIENATVEKLLGGVYRSKMNPKSLTASLFAWCARYRFVPLFCSSESTPTVIAAVLRYEVREMLERGEFDV
jgi:ERCC4-type nuclease